MFSSFNTGYLCMVPPIKPYEVSGVLSKILVSEGTVSHPTLRIHHSQVYYTFLGSCLPKTKI